MDGDKRQTTRVPVANSSVCSRALGRTREPPGRLVDVNEMNHHRLHRAVRSAPSASRARSGAARERFAPSTRRRGKTELQHSFHNLSWCTRTS